MKHELQVEIVKEMLDQIDNNRAFDAGQVVITPASNYTSEALAEREWETFFRTHPQVIGLSGELPKPGSFITVDAVDFSVPILATRDKTGKFRAFVNSCRHRGTQLETAARGEKSRFVCPYHAWTYAEDGRLIGISSNPSFGQVDKSCHGLIELPAAEKHGFLFVHPQRDGVIDIDSLITPEFAEELDTLELHRCEYAGEATFDLPLNWKIANDTFGEQYHFAHLHKSTLAQVLHGNTGTFKAFGRNYRGSVANRYIEAMRGKPESEWSLFDGGMLTYYLFPNINIVLMNGMMIFARIYPNRKNVGQSLTRVTYLSTPQFTKEVPAEKALSSDNLYTPDTSEPMVFSLSAMIELFNSTVSGEDYAMGSQIQIAASSGAVEQFMFGRNEAGLQHFHNNFKSALGDPPLEEYKAA